MSIARIRELQTIFETRNHEHRWSGLEAIYETLEKIQSFTRELSEDIYYDRTLLQLAVRVVESVGNDLNANRLHLFTSDQVRATHECLQAVLARLKNPDAETTEFRLKEAIDYIKIARASDSNNQSLLSVATMKSLTDFCARGTAAGIISGVISALCKFPAISCCLLTICCYSLLPEINQDQTENLTLIQKARKRETGETLIRNLGYFSERSNNEVVEFDARDYATTQQPEYIDDEELSAGYSMP